MPENTPIAIPQLAEHLGNLSVVEIIALTKQLEEQWGVKAVPQVVEAAPPPTGPTTQLEEQTEFTVTLVDSGAKKVEIIKAIREITSLGLSESKAFTENVPKVVKEGVSKAEAEAVKTRLEAAGAKAEIK
jgi:large subunit ribosomal protein L7/L12